MENLRNRVTPYETTKYNNSRSVFGSGVKPYYKYISVLIITFISLFVLRPTYIKSIRIDDKGYEIYKLDVDKLMYFTIIISSVISIGIFFYYKNKSGV